MDISKAKKVFIYSALTVFALFSLLLFSFSLDKKECTPFFSASKKEKAVEKEINLVPQEGDIIFHSSQSNQCKAIQLATKSPYSHCGILFTYNGSLQVLEGVQPVQITPINKFIERGKSKHYVIKRLKNASTVLTSEKIAEMKKIGNSFKGKDYDIYFNWGDEQIYCSELVWKIYDRALSIQLGELKPLSSFDLSHPEVKAIMEERYGKKIPLSELMISPGAIFESDLLITVEEK